MKLTDFTHKCLSIILTKNQKFFLNKMIKKYGLCMQIFRMSINLQRFKKIHNNLSKRDRSKLEKVFNITRLRSGHSKVALVQFNININADLCELYAFLTGDGYMLKHCRFFNYNKVLVKRFNKLLYKNFKIKARQETKENFHYIPKVIQVILEILFCPKGHSRDAKVPPIIFNLSKNLGRAYIRALFDTDGSVVNDPPKLASKSLELLKGVNKLLFDKFRIESRIRGNENAGYELVIGNGNKYNVFFNTLKFYEEINFLHPNKKRTLEDKIKNRTLYKILHLVGKGYNSSTIIRKRLNIDWSTIIEHLNTLTKYGYLNRIKTNEGNKHIWIMSKERKV